jgi:hypothetical protein
MKSLLSKLQCIAKSFGQNEAIEAIGFKSSFSGVNFTRI